MLRRLANLRPGLTASVLLGLVVSASAGCQAWHNALGRWGTWDDEGFSAEEQRLTEGVRPRERNTKPAAVTAKGRQVERNFGIGDE